MSPRTFYVAVVRPAMPLYEGAISRPERRGEPAVRPVPDPASEPVCVGPRCGSADRHRVEQGLGAGEDAGEGGTRGGDVEPAGAIPGEAAPAGQPAEAALRHPPAGEHDEA